MSVTGSPFCEHKKLRTSCAICKPQALPVDDTLRATPFVSEEEREKAAAKRERRASSAPAIERNEESEKPRAPPGARGPGKPLLPQRKKANRNISAAEADAVKPWWVKK